MKRLPRLAITIGILFALLVLTGAVVIFLPQPLLAQPGDRPNDIPVIRARYANTLLEGLRGSSCWPRPNNAPLCDFVDSPQPTTRITVQTGETVAFIVDPLLPEPTVYLASLPDAAASPPRDLLSTDGEFVIDDLDPGPNRVEVLASYPGDQAGSEYFVIYYFLLQVEASQPATPAATTEATTEPTPELTPEATPAVTPAATPEAMPPGGTPEATPEATTEVTAAATTAAVPVATEEQTVQPTAEPTDAATPAPTTQSAPIVPSSTAEATAETGVVATIEATAATGTPSSTPTFTSTPTPGLLATTAVAPVTATPSSTITTTATPGTLAATITQGTTAVAATTVVPSVTTATAGTPVVSPTTGTISATSTLIVLPTNTPAGSPTALPVPTGDSGAVVLVPALRIVIGQAVFDPIAVRGCQEDALGTEQCVEGPLNAVRSPIVAVPGSLAQVQFDGPRPSAVVANLYGGNGLTLQRSEDLGADNVTIYVMPGLAGTYWIELVVSWDNSTLTYSFRLAVEAN